MQTYDIFRAGVVSALADEPTLDGLVDGLERGLRRSLALWECGEVPDALSLLRQVRADVYRHRDMLRIYGDDRRLICRVEALWQQFSPRMAA
jgi:hypothetical protein